ncbi:MAG TPA: class I SAM-dependent methyltransferase [Roseiarcus sp.]|jgi:SAM-dependent methyltransferase
MGRFASTVAYYESARAPYGAAFFTAAAQKLGLDRSQRLLDVGAGPGILAIGFKPYCREVVGVDPEPGMVQAARAAAEGAGVAVRFIEGRFEDVAPRLGVFDIVTIGRAIHWLDPEPARAALERALAPQGKVMVCHASSLKDGRNRWLGTFNAVRDRWKGDRPSRDHDTFFADGHFIRTGAIRVEATYTVPVERLVERVLSMSTSSSERLRDEVPLMKSAMREALAPFAPDGMIEDIVEARAEVFERA